MAFRRKIDKEYILLNFQSIMVYVDIFFQEKDTDKLITQENH